MSTQKFGFTRSAVALTLAAASAWLGSTPAHADDTLDRIKERKRVVIGVVVSGGPFGAIDPATQQLTGFNPEVARGLAQGLGTDVELVAVLPSNRIQYLQQKRVDLLVASMEWTEERATQLTFAPTPYYRNGGAAIFRKDSGITRWEDLAGKPVCLSQGSNYGKPLTEQYGAQLKGFRGASESLLALRGGNCVAAVHDGTLIYRLVEDDAEWKGYAAPFDELIPSPSVVWVRPGEKDTAQAVDRVIQGWHRDGWLIATEKRVGISRPSAALVELQGAARAQAPLPQWAQK
ncbi:transporter substrate-binding domain-containing protein [Schauerella aestuarii]|uniref:transporter substrate-binding domain-containing protein n=1 Tax=Schauerella aestuarii TaxID=2511204 RepID=UPI001371ADD2|nr:transporter substrate-binding domain-containing protein [Achromobacter aestuarii]MYZ45522.1 transporter substrate-binding domain-containing protein [Achromobacter aestuarii]